MAAANVKPRGRFQFSLQTLLIVMVAACLLLDRLRPGSGGLGTPQEWTQGLLHYFLLLFGVGPWFARLVGECFPFTRVTVRLSLSNVLLVLLFIGGLRITDAWFGPQSNLYMCMATLVLWTPQYMIFFLWSEETLTPDEA